MTPGTCATATLINTADKAGYTLFVTHHSHIYIRQATLHTRLISQRHIYNGRLHTFIFLGDDMHHTAIMCVYAFQRNYTSADTTHTPRHFKSKVLEIATSLCALYDPLTLIVM